MANPLLGVLGNQASGVSRKSVAQQFREFRESFKGDPQKKLDELVKSGQITQEQLDNATQLANMVAGMMKK